MHRHYAGRLALLCACFLPELLNASPAAASVATPIVTGVIRDSLGNALPNVQVIVAEAGRSTTTGTDGRFSFRGLPTGEYHLTALLVGYRPGHAVVTVPAAGAEIQVSIVMAATPLRLQAVNVTASPTGTEPARVAQATVEVSGLALQRSLANTIAQSLGGEPGVAVRLNGPATMPVIRGLTGDRVLVLQDGARTGDLSAATSDHGTTVDPLTASRMEVVRGPASLLYGNNALGGVVNVITDDIPTAVPSHLQGYAGAIGETATPGGSGVLSLTSALGESWALNVRGSYRKATSMKTGGGGTLENTQSKNWNGNAGLGFVGQRVTAGASLSSYDFSYGLPADPDHGGELVHLEGRRTSVAFKSSVNTRSDAVPFFKLDATVQDYRHDEIETDGAIGTAFRLKTQTLNGSAKTQFGHHLKGVLGAQLLAKQYDATGEEALTPAANTNGIGVFGYQEFPLGGDGEHELLPTLSIGARFDSYRIESKAGDPKFGAARAVDISSPSGSIGLSVPVGELITITGSAALAFRAPTVEELFSNAVHHANGSYEIGNPALEAEQSRGLEAGVRLSTGRVSANVSGYLNSISNYVFPDVARDTVVDGEEMPLAIYAQRDARVSGFEGSMEFRATDRVVLGGMTDFVRGSFESGGALPFMPPARVGGTFRWDDGRWNIGADVRHAFEQTRTTGGADVDTDAYTLLNLSAGLNVIAGGRVHTVTLRVDNATDARYFDATSRIKEFAPSAGRNVALVYKVLF
jgi:iron complex outermembrane receptor protein